MNYLLLVVMIQKNKVLIKVQMKKLMKIKQKTKKTNKKIKNNKN